MFHASCGMLDIKFIRENQKRVKEGLKNKGVSFDIKQLLELDEKRRTKIKEVDDLRARQNVFADAVAKAKGEERKKKIFESQEVKKTLNGILPDLEGLEKEFVSLMRQLPNVPLDDVPVGKNEWENRVLREVGAKKKFAFHPRDYMVLAQNLGLIDVRRAAKVSGSRFGYLLRDAALLEIALVRFAYDELLKKKFIPVIPPVLIKEEMMAGMGYIDSKKDQEERYFFEKDKLYLVGTSEQSIGPMHAGEILPEKDLPLRYAGFSTCFRREAGSYGKDTHGILRVHQFDKVEMFTISRPEDADQEHQLMLAVEEEFMQKLGIPYRVVMLCTGDLSHPSARTYDIEAWLPGQNNGTGEYRETHSTSTTTDFQARRLHIRFKKKDGTTEFAHTLNGTACAIGRTSIAILENYQNEDGSVAIPEVLRSYMGGMKAILPQHESRTK